MKLLIFKLKLLLYLASFLLDISLDQIKRAKVALLIIFVIFLIANLTLLLFVKRRVGNEADNKDTIYSPTRADLYEKSEKTESEILDEIEYWENILKKQPYSRDALVNLSILKRIISQDEDAKELWQKAELIDPNNQIFK